MLEKVFSRLPIIVFLLVLMPLPAQELPKREPVASLVFSFAGDVYMSDEGAGSKGSSFLYQDLVPLLHGDDASFLNLNSPVTNRRTQRKPPNANPLQIEAMVNAGFDIFSLANDHVVEQGLQGIYESLSSWNSLWQRFPWIRYNGIKENTTDAIQASLFSRKNKNLAFLALVYRPSDLKQKKEAYNLVNTIDYHDATQWTALLAYIKELRRQVDLLIISCHGKEGAEDYESWAQTMRAFIDAGADIVWNHDRAQYNDPVEFYQDKLIIHNNGTLLTEEVWNAEGSEEDLIMAASGHSLLYRLSWYWYADKSERFVVEAMPLSNYFHPQLGRLIIRSDDMRTLKSLPPVWRMYYERLLQGWSEDLQRGEE